MDDEVRKLIIEEAEHAERMEQLEGDPAYEEAKMRLSRRDKNLQVRLSIAEFSLLREMAEKEDLPVGTSARNLILQALDTRKSSSSKEAAATRG